MPGVGLDKWGAGPEPDTGTNSIDIQDVVNRIPPESREGSPSDSVCHPSMTIASLCQGYSHGVNVAVV